LSRSEGLLLRYLTEVYKTLVQTVPEQARNEDVEDLIGRLGTIVRGVDSSLLDEWERLRSGPHALAAPEQTTEEESSDITRNVRAFTALVRNHLFSFLRALQSRDYESALDLADDSKLTPADLEHAIRPLFEEGARIRLDAVGRSPANTVIEARDDVWHVTQAIVVEDEISEYSVRGRIDLSRSGVERRPVFLLDHVGAG
jgi:hypothetical protein